MTRAAYADPPYPGLAWRYPERTEVDFPALLAQLATFDIWALSCHSPALRILLPLCPPTVRVAAWVKPYAVFRPNVNPAYAWEAVLFHRARRGPRSRRTVRDWVSAPCAMVKGFVGAKPPAFCYWLFELLGLVPTDEFHDLFPGSGAVTTAWQQWCAWQGRLRPELEL